MRWIEIGITQAANVAENEKPLRGAEVHVSKGD